MDNKQETYVPEYKPQKYSKASQITKIISLILLGLMFVSVAYIVAEAFLFNPEAYQANVNGVMTFDSSYFIIVLSLPVCGFGLMSLFAWVLHSRLKAANLVFATADEDERKELHEKFDKQAKTARVVATVHSVKEFIKKD